MINELVRFMNVHVWGVAERQGGREKEGDKETERISWASCEPKSLVNICTEQRIINKWWMNILKIT
jgi:hypothetical protein